MPAQFSLLPFSEKVVRSVFVSQLPEYLHEAEDKEMYDLKHELISVQIKLENADKALDKLKEENKELQMKIVQLETEIKNNKEN